MHYRNRGYTDETRTSAPFGFSTRRYAIAQGKKLSDHLHGFQESLDTKCKNILMLLILKALSSLG
ncbi:MULTISPECIES: hypothetical protein [unclassified Nostoc]|uniref:hypothetical protein n=1 Tax=unclassified Nostoc TaxID=2593658 RepID=UPI002AD98352|nr:hypothetical protein [Nostoc sp. DedQUE02]